METWKVDHKTSNILVCIKAFKSWPQCHLYIFIVHYKIFHIGNIQGGGDDDIRRWIAVHPRLMVVK